MNQTPTPSRRDSFYAGPATSNDDRPGQILRRRAVTTPNLSAAGQAWQLIYATRTSHSAPIPASGIVITPETSEHTAGAVLYYPAFQGLGGRAPSQRLAHEDPWPERHYIEILLERGWTVALPDGLSRGITGCGPHQFLAGRAAAHAVLDLARAVMRLAELDNGPAPLAVWGYADGGRAAIWSAEQQPRYAPELDLRLAVAGAAIADPGALLQAIDGGQWAGLVLAGMIGLGRAYAHMPVYHLLTDDGHAAVAHGATLEAVQLLTTYANRTLGQWCERDDPWNDAIWRYVLANETSARETPPVPLHLYHGTEDGIIPIATGRELADRYRALGADITWREYHTTHAATAAAGCAEAIAQITDHLSPGPTTVTTPAT